MIYSSIEPKLIADICAFRGASGNPDRPRTRDASKLAYEGSHRPARRGHDHRFTNFGLTDHFHARIGRESRHA
jgi:hypothetical protein